MVLTVRPLTPETWPDLEELFGRWGASNGCWCMYWRIGPAYASRLREENRAALMALTPEGPPPGLLAFDGDLAAGWCQVTPRGALSWLNARVARHAPDGQVWSLSCFYVCRGYRRQGVASRLVAAAVAYAREAGAAALEAYPLDTAAPHSTSNLFTGAARTFERTGFRTVGWRSPSRPIMRHDLDPAAARAGDGG